MESVEVVAETPLESQVGSGCDAPDPDRAEVIPESPLGAAAVPSPVVPPPVPMNSAGNIPARSYLETVVGNGSGTAPFLLANETACPTCPKEGDVDDSAPVTAIEMTVQNRDEGPTGVKAGDVSAGRSFVHGSRPYGPWMIATRRERRPQGQGRPVDNVPQRAHTSNYKEKAPATGSRFALLDSGEGHEDVPNQIANESDASPQAECLGLAQRFANISFHHVFREQNQAADMLAKTAHSHSMGLTFWDDAPPGLEDIIREDIMGAKFFRRVSTFSGILP
nr:heat shock 70 kDa protein-like [Ipomoea batatas]